MKLINAALLALLVSGGPVLADGAINAIITKADRERLDNFEAVRAAALKEAAADRNSADYAALAPLIEPKLPLKGLNLSGNWRCRTIKVGKILPVVAYGWFRCRVTDDGSGWRLEKLNGSQRTQGRFYDDGADRMIYLGAGYVNDNKPPKYGASIDSDQVGYAFRTGPNAWRIEFPSPRLESNLDIIEFKR